MSHKPSRKSKPPPLLDLHGFRPDDVPDALDQFLRKGTAQGHSQVRVMTGKGAGKILSETQKYLRLGGFPFSFEKMESGKLNEGVLVVFIGDD